MKRGDNFKGFDAPVMALNGEQELEAFDKLGPCTRQAMRDSPIKWSAAAIIIQIEHEQERVRALLPEFQRVLFKIDLKDPDLDRNIARGIMLQAMQILMRDRSREDAELGIRPLRARRTRRAF